MKRIKNIGWTLGNDCICKCKHCYSLSVREKGKNLTKEIIDRIVNQIKDIGGETVNLGGNEPIYTNGLNVADSLLPYILEQLSLNNIKVGITTSGISLIELEKNYPSYLHYLNDVDISLDSPIENEHNDNRGGHVYHYAIQAMELCRDNDIEFGIITCAMNWNFTKDRIDGLIKIAKHYNSNIRFNILKPIDEKYLKFLPTKEQVLEMYKYLFELCDTLEISEPILSRLVNNSKVQGCACGEHSLRINSITPDGKIPVSPCVYMHDFRVGNLMEESLSDIVSSPQFAVFKQRKKEYRKIKGCAECEKSDICRGGCFAMAYSYEKIKAGESGIFAKDPFCYKDVDIENMPKLELVKSSKKLVHENYLCTWIGKPK